MKESLNYYDILQVSLDADKEMIKKNFRLLSLKYHPDLNKNSKIDYLSILNAYKTLIDDHKRVEYNRLLSDKEKQRLMREHYDQSEVIIPSSRIEYSLSFWNILKAGFKFSRKFKHADYLWGVGQDMIIRITPEEAAAGALAIITVPARMACPVCGGRDLTCYRCNGLRFVKTTEKISIRIHPGVKDGDILEIDLKNQDYIHKNTSIPFYIRTKKLKIKICFL